MIGLVDMNDEDDDDVYNVRDNGAGINQLASCTSLMNS